MDLVVIDSGHGGSDPGKVGINEVLEKDINLKIWTIKPAVEDDFVIFEKGDDDGE